MRRMRETTGFSPLEVLIAMAILMIGIVAVIRLFPRGLEHARIARERTQAAELADTRLGRIRMAGAEQFWQLVKYGNPLDDLLAVNLNDAVHMSETFELDDQYRVDPEHALYSGYHTTVQRLRGAENTYLQRVTFSIEMPDGRRETYVTYISAI